MSKERELLKRFMTELKTEEDVVSLFNDIKECLAQPEQTEQEPVAWKVIDETNDGAFSFSEVKPMERYYKDYVVIPLYTAPPKREPLSSIKILELTSKHEYAINLIRAVEKEHGIGVDDESI